MALTYPLSTPTTIGIENIEFRAVNAVATSQSPFTYKQQIVQHTGQRWEATITIPPVKRDLAEEWVAFILALKGQTGTFLLGDPLGTAPRGTASSNAGTPVVNGADQTGEVINIDGLPTSETGYLLAGDYIQLGSGSTATLHKVLEQVNTTGLGEASFAIWPSIITAPADNAIVTLTNAKGRFRLKNNTQSWQINNINSYGISFEAVQAIP